MVMKKWLIRCTKEHQSLLSRNPRPKREDVVVEGRSTRRRAEPLPSKKQAGSGWRQKVVLLGKAIQGKSKPQWHDEKD